MVSPGTPRKHTQLRTQLLVIAFILLAFSAGTASAATKKVIRRPAETAKKTVTHVKGERVTASAVSVIGNNTISTYTVKNGDTLSGIAQKFGITVNTIRWSNDITSTDKIKPGEKLIILPTSGIVYKVKNGDTLSGIAQKFNADQNDILNANDLADADSLKTGMTLVIPNAEPQNNPTPENTIGPAENIAPITATEQTGGVQTPTVPAATQPSPEATAGNAQTPETQPTEVQTPVGTTIVVTNPVTTATYPITVTSPAGVSSYAIPADDIRGYYAQPISGRLSQGIHAVNAVDIAAPIGTTVHAAANGTVIVAMGNHKYNGGYGNYIVISHPNGTQTLYAHLSKVTVALGDMVVQGEPIGLSGNTGDTTGPHLHFEVRGATNPWGSDPINTEYTI